MRIQLLLANQEVELTKDVQIPLNTAYQNLWNPTDIIVDYSKTISIPITVTNNKVLGNAYRLDRTIVENRGNDNIGLYLDPTKRIPFNLLYNGQELMSGYAKFTSANYSKNNKSYNLNLFGVLGDFFYKMRGVVTSQDRLTDEQRAESDGGMKYVLNDHIGGASLDANYVLNSWNHTNNNINNFSDSSIIDQDIIGFAPAYRGYYGMDFKSSNVQVNDSEIMNLSTLLEEEWRNTYCLNVFGVLYQDATESQQKESQDFASQLGASDVIGDGMKEYQMGEYRSYHQRPFIYINKLFYMFQEKSKSLTGYDLKFDPAWFNKDNPYWSKLVYTLNYLEDIEELPNTQQFASKPAPVNLYQSPSDDVYAVSSFEYKLTPASSALYLQPTVINQVLQFDNRSTNYFSYGIRANDKCAMVFDVTVSNGSTSKTYKFWSRLGHQLYKPNISGLNDSNHFFTFTLDDNNNSNGFVGLKLDYFKQTFTSVLPKIDVPIDEGMEGVEHTITIKSYVYAPSSPFVLWTGAYGSSKVGLWDSNLFPKVSMTEDVLLSYKTTKSNSINIGLNILYLDEEPIFNVLLQYTKMYGLYWKLDGVGKTVTIMRPSTYFKDYSISDWNHKLDRSKDCIIEPITFDSNYVNFNYDDVDGFKYASYKEKYGVNYGTKKLKTNYNFDSSDKDLFEGVKPSIVSQRSYVKYSTLRDWNINKTTLPIISNTIDDLPRIESVDSDDERCINESSWYFRLGNVDLSEPIYITDDSELMIKENNYCWFTRAWLDESYVNGQSGIVKTSSLPQFHIVTTSGSRPFGCIFNCPKEDYTLNKTISSSLNGYIYDNIWSKFINERYNVQNKKVTAYFDITPWEYMSFDFSKFITLGNQLFMVNKIFDYDINSSATTKCELVQITDPSAYAQDIIDFNNITPVDPEEPTYGYTLTSSESNLTVDANSQSVSVIVTSVKYTNGVGAFYQPSYTCDTNVTEMIDGSNIIYTLSIPENLSESPKSYKLTVSNPETSIEIIINQSAGQYNLSPELISLIQPTGGIAHMIVESTRNSTPVPLTASNVSLSGIEGAYVSYVTEDSVGRYDIAIYVPENTTASVRELDYTITQPESGKVLTGSLTQGGKVEPSGSDEFKVTAHAYFDGDLNGIVRYEVLFDATDTSLYYGGEARNVTVTLSTARNGVGNFVQTTPVDVLVEAGSSQTVSGSLRSNGTYTIYVNLYYDNQLKTSFQPMRQVDQIEPISI